MFLEFEMVKNRVSQKKCFSGNGYFLLKQPKRPEWAEILLFPYFATHFFTCRYSIRTGNSANAALQTGTLDGFTKLNLAGREDRWIKLVTQPVQLPDLNVIDLGFFVLYLNPEFGGSATTREMPL